MAWKKNTTHALHGGVGGSTCLRSLGDWLCQVGGSLTQVCCEVSEIFEVSLEMMVDLNSVLPSIGQGFCKMLSSPEALLFPAKMSFAHPTQQMDTMVNGW